MVPAAELELHHVGWQPAERLVKPTWGGAPAPATVVGDPGDGDVDVTLIVAGVVVTGGVHDAPEATVLAQRQIVRDTRGPVSREGARTAGIQRTGGVGLRAPADRKALGRGVVGPEVPPLPVHREVRYRHGPNVFHLHRDGHLLVTYHR